MPSALQSGELKAHLQEALGPGGMVPPLQERLHTLLQSAAVLLFMKGSPDQPRCGYSRKVRLLPGCFLAAPYSLLGLHLTTRRQMS